VRVKNKPKQSQFWLAPRPDLGVSRGRGDHSQTNLQNKCQWNIFGNLLKNAINPACQFVLWGKKSDKKRQNTENGMEFEENG